MAKMRLLYKWRKKHVENIREMCQSFISYASFSNHTLLYVPTSSTDKPMRDV